LQQSLFKNDGVQMNGAHESEPNTSVFILSLKHTSARGNASGSSPQYFCLACSQSDPVCISSRVDVGDFAFPVKIS
jgi:hypothetical protein